MGNDDDDSFGDVDGLLEQIGGKKKPNQPDAKKEVPSVPVTPAPPAPASVPKSPSARGDFSLLMKKLGIASKDGAPVVSKPDPSSISSPEKASLPEPAAPPILNLDDLLEDEPPAPAPVRNVSSTPVESAPSQPPAARKDVLSEDPSPSSQETPSPAAEKEILPEIRDDDPRIVTKKEQLARKAKAVQEDEPLSESEDVTDEKIISVDQISDITGLILPKGATFHIEELKLHSRINAFESTGIGELPDEFAEIWKKEFSTAGFHDLDLADTALSDKETLKPAVKKFSIASLFAAIRTTEEEYDARKHGALVDLAFAPKAGIEEMEMYPVNEPYAYVRITYDHSTHEYTYNVLEPVLTEPEKNLLKEIKERLFETLDINTKDLSREEARQKLRSATNEILQDYGIRLTPVQKEKLHYNMHKDFLGDGLIDPIMHDKYIEDISCDGVHTPIFAFHASYESMKTTLAYHTSEELDSFVTKLAQRAGKYISIAEPILDASMQDGSRIQMTLGTEVTAHGSTFTIRKFKDEPITPTDLIEWHTFAPLSIAYIWLAVETGKSAIFAGGTASGKTTALNAISLFIPPMAKIVSLEDTRELKLPHPNWIPSVTRDSFDSAGRGEINMYELLRAAMRQRPEYIIVGEVRGKECQTLFQAMSTGHVTYSTTHADSVASVVHRIENPPMDVPRNMLSSLDFICIQVQARVGGKRIRRNKQIVEILDIDPRTNELITNEVFKWRSATDEISYSGKSYILEEIMEAKGWSENRMREELKRRQEVLEWMRIKKIRHYKDVAKILISYHRDPEAVIEKVRKDLYE